MALDTAKATVTLRSLTQKFDTGVRGASAFYPTLCTTINSTGLNEQYASLGDMPGVREWVDDRVFHELRAANFLIENKHWESSLAIKKTDIDDDRLGMYGPLLENLGRRAIRHPDKLLFETVLANAESEACFDGQFFFDTDHAWGDSGSQSNDLTYAAATGTTPTVAEFKASFHQAITTMLAYKNDRGDLFYEPVVQESDMNGFLVMVPLELWETAKTALESALLGGGDSNIRLSMARIVVSPFLTDATKWYLFKTDEILKPFIFQARQPLSRQMKGMDDREFKDVKFMTEARYNMGYLAWWTAVLTTFT